MFYCCSLIYLFFSIQTWKDFFIETCRPLTRVATKFFRITVLYLHIVSFLLFSFLFFEASGIATVSSRVALTKNCLCCREAGVDSFLLWIYSLWYLTLLLPRFALLSCFSWPSFLHTHVIVLGPCPLGLASWLRCWHHVEPAVLLHFPSLGRWSSGL